jgi:hypothetical protein
VRYAFVVPPLREIAKRVFPAWFVDWYRRRRLVRNYLRALGHELQERRYAMLGGNDDLEDVVAARHDGFYQRAVQEILDRCDLVLQQLDRKIEGVTARHSNELRTLREEVAALKASLESLKTTAPTG